MAIVLKKADLSLINRLGIIDTLSVYIDDVLVASASDEKSISWAISMVDSANLAGNDLVTVITINEDEALTFPMIASYVPSITEGPSSGTASVAIADVTLYIPSETINLSSTAASPPTITEAYYSTGGSVWGGAASVTLIELNASVGVTSYTPTITEGPSGNASVGYSASVTIS